MNLLGYLMAERKKLKMLDQLKCLKPQFNVNLLSVSKLTRGLKCIVIFFDKLCYARCDHEEDDGPRQAV